MKIKIAITLIIIVSWSITSQEIKKYNSTASYPSLTSRGDIFQLYQNQNNTLEIGVAGRENSRRSWILSRHSDLNGNYGQYYSTLHLQPNTGTKSQYRGVAIGYSADTYIGHSTHLAVDGKVGIGTITPSVKLEIKSNETKFLKFHREGLSKKGHIGYGTANQGGVYIGTDDNTYSLWVQQNGNVGIGTYNPGLWKLAVNGKIKTKEVKVSLEGWSDFVFYDNYKLPTLKEVENHIKEKGHLKDIPSAKEVEKNGIFLGEMDAKLLQKIEELTLYSIQQEKNINAHKKENKQQSYKIKKLEKENVVLKSILLEFQKRLEKLETKN